MPSSTSSEAHSALAERLFRIPEAEAVVFPYRLARLVARVLASQRLRQRRKWCSLAQELARDPMVEERSVKQAIGWLERRATMKATFGPGYMGGPAKSQ
ncbi:hypothetical protein [Brevifollis gellanilyticus]|uniref:Uncharacterized protein n=1 Tax=Brevifollis gellanilyticus TaxID=748831 RepID=A0A512M4P3_9BACT|nr:hypothetical protein [Brevifollis gellanilyticus]GEP41709.1 hypothetical protein BGE01nite_10000 [Brevifollis gellanilyticus]